MKEMLNKIVAHKELEIADRVRRKPLSMLRDDAHYHRACISLRSRISAEDATGIIAEFKHRSPSRPNINIAADLLTILECYAQSDVSAFSILTDEHFFGGKDDYVSQARKEFTEIPILRKEFIINPYQIHEAKTLGADAILLIAEILDVHQIDEFCHEAAELSMEILIELHSEKHIDKISDKAHLIGINNRDLDTFQIDYDRSIRMIEDLPSGKVKIAESGLSDPETLIRLYNAGFYGFLIGETFMKQTDLSDYLPRFIEHYMSGR